MSRVLPENDAYFQSRSSRDRGKGVYAGRAECNVLKTFRRNFRGSFGPRLIIPCVSLCRSRLSFAFLIARIARSQSTLKMKVPCPGLNVQKWPKEKRRAICPNLETHGGSGTETNQPGRVLIFSSDCQPQCRHNVGSPAGHTEQQCSA